MLKNKNLCLAVSVVLLLTLYIISFSKNNNGKENRKSIQTQLINQKYKDKIRTFQLKKGNELLTISRDNGNFWIVHKDPASPEIYPADVSKMDSFITDLCSLRSLYKITNKISDENDFGFTDSSSYTIRYTMDDGSVQEIIFGNQDYTFTYRYFMSGSSLAVYQVDDVFGKYLNLSIQNWTDPNIISTAVTGKFDVYDIQRVMVNYNGQTKELSNKNTDEFFTKMFKLLELRHGTVCQPEENFEAEYKMQIELGDKKWITLSVSKTQDAENDYTVQTTYFKETDSITYCFAYKISPWTYNKIKEITL